MTREEYNQLSSIIIDCAINVHRRLGPGLLESIYQDSLVAELQSKGLKVEQQVKHQLELDSVQNERFYKIDILVENSIVLEIKAVENLLPVHAAQLLTYMKLGNYKLGLLLNFNVVLMKHGIKRLVNNF